MIFAEVFFKRKPRNQLREWYHSRKKRVGGQEICKKQNASFFEQLTAVYFILSSSIQRGTRISAHISWLPFAKFALFWTHISAHSDFWVTDSTVRGQTLP
jgi:hypothetical protein